MDRRPDGSIRIRQTYLTQSIINMIPGMDKSSDNPTHAFKPTLEKMRQIKQKITLVIDQ